MTVQVLPYRDVAEQPWVGQQLVDGWGGTRVARLDEVVDASAMPGFVALEGDRPAGYAVVAPDDRRGYEVLVLESLVPGRGVGRALLGACRADAVRRGAGRLWLVTTNDNDRALVVYQRFGFDLWGLHRDAVTRARALKPSIPTHDGRGIPLRHELELEILLAR